MNNRTKCPSLARSALTRVREGINDVSEEVAVVVAEETTAAVLSAETPLLVPPEEEQMITTAPSEADGGSPGTEEGPSHSRVNNREGRN